MRIEWDSGKAKTNLQKHKVSFEEAKTVFYDEQALFIGDPDHSDLEEERFVLIRRSQKLRLLVVCHCYRESAEIIRIISARKATKKESGQYKENSLIYIACSRRPN